MSLNGVSVGVCSLFHSIDEETETWGNGKPCLGLECLWL